MLVTDAMPPVGGMRSNFNLNGEPIVVRDGRCAREDGRLAGACLDMASAVRNCVRLLDVPLTQALRFASTNPAHFLGLGDRLGKLAPGYRADPDSLRASSSITRAGDRYSSPMQPLGESRSAVLGHVHNRSPLPSLEQAQVTWLASVATGRFQSAEAISTRDMKRAGWRTSLSLQSMTVNTFVMSQTSMQQWHIRRISFDDKPLMR